MLKVFPSHHGGECGPKGAIFGTRRCNRGRQSSVVDRLIASLTAGLPKWTSLHPDEWRPFLPWCFSVKKALVGKKNPTHLLTGSLKEQQRSNRRAEQGVFDLVSQSTLLLAYKNVTANKRQCHGFIRETCGPSGTNGRNRTSKLGMITEFKHRDSHTVLRQQFQRCPCVNPGLGNNDEVLIKTSPVG